MRQLMNRAPQGAVRFATRAVRAAYHALGDCACVRVQDLMVHSFGHLFAAALSSGGMISTVSLHIIFMQLEENEI